MKEGWESFMFNGVVEDKITLVCVQGVSGVSICGHVRGRETGSSLLVVPRHLRQLSGPRQATGMKTSHPLPSPISRAHPNLRVWD